MKKYLIFVPTLISIVCTLVSLFLKKYNIQIEILDFVLFIYYIYGIVFIAPIFYVFCIGWLKNSKIGFINLTLISTILIKVNTVIICPESLLYYFKIKERGVHDLDLLPMYLIVPCSIVFLGIMIVGVIKRVQKRKKML